MTERIRFFGLKGYARIVLGVFLSLFLVLPRSSHAQTPPRPGPPRARVLVAYSSTQGHTKKMAEAVASGARTIRDVDVIVEDVSKISFSTLPSMDAIIVGGPVYNANIAPEIQAFINKWPFKEGSMHDKIGAAFVSAGGMSAGEELAQLSILHSMLVFGMIVVGGDNWRSAFGASAVTGESSAPPPLAPPAGSRENVDDYYLKKAEALGKRVAKLALQKARCF